MQAEQPRIHKPMTKQSLSVLIANITMSGRSGTEVVTRMLAEGLLRRGHRPMVYTSSLGPLAHELRSMSVPVTDEIGQVQCKPDIIHGNHNPTTATAIVRFPDVPALFVCHDFVAWHSGPPVLPQIKRFAAVSEAGVDRLCAEHGISPELVTLLLNAIDTKRFRRTRTLPDKPLRLLAYTNYSTHIEALREACRSRNLSLEIVGGAVNQQNSKPERLLPDFDLVFTSGLGAMEAMSCGAAVVLCDGRGVAGMITEDRFAAWRRENFGLRTLLRPVTTGIIADEIDKYDAGSATRVSDKLRQQADIELHLDQVCALYERVIVEHQTTQPPTSIDVAIAAARHIERWGPHGSIGALLAQEKLRLLGQILNVRSGLGFMELGDTCRFTRETDNAWHKLYGFSMPESWGTWSVGSDAMLLLNVRFVGAPPTPLPLG